MEISNAEFLSKQADDLVTELNGLINTLSAYLASI